MNAARPANVLRQLERDCAPGTDADLLARFMATKDTDAFAELVRRHGPLVLGVCRRVTGQAQDAEDAFQATFLVLAKKAATLRSPELLGNYLYGVAFRVASRAKRSALRRRAREVVVPTLPDPPAPSPQSAMPELTPILDEELAALPACYREAIVLCDLRGAPREVAAAALGVPEGTLSSRLAVGRKKLAARLTRRGITLSAAAVPTVLAEARATASPAVPNELVTKTCGVVADWATGAPVPLPLSRLITGGFPVRKVLLLGAVMVVGVAGAVFATQPRDEPPAVDPPKPPLVFAAAPADGQPNRDPKVADNVDTNFISAPKLRAATDIAVQNVNAPAWSNDGRFFAFQGNSLPGTKNEHISWVVVLGIDNGECRSISQTDSKGIGTLVGFSPDSRELITEKREYSLVSGFHWLRYRTLPEKGHDPTVRTVNLDLPETHGYAFAADGKTYRTAAWHRDATGPVSKIEILEVDARTGKSGKSLLKIDFGKYALAPNGKRLAVLDKESSKVTVYDLDRGAKQFEYTLPGEQLASLPPVHRPSIYGASGVVFGPGGPSGPLDRQSEPVMIFSPDARRLLVSRAIGQTVVLNAETGEGLPALEGLKEARIVPDSHAFSGDGRLLAAPGTNYKLGKRRPGGGTPKNPPPEQTVWEPGASFLTVWDTRTGKAVKSWNRSPRVMFHPTKPMLAILEHNGDSGTRIGFWDFAAEVEKK